MDNFEVGKILRNIIYFMAGLIVFLILWLGYCIYQLNNTAVLETITTEQNGVYNFVDSTGNVISTDEETIMKALELYYGEYKSNEN